MKRFLILLIAFVYGVTAYAREYAWLCAIERTDENHNWVFVSEDLKLQNDGNYRVFVKWEFTDDPNKSRAMQVWLISPDLTMIKVVRSVGYDREGRVAYTNNEPEDWDYVMPNTYAEAVIEVAGYILESQEKTK